MVCCFFTAFHVRFYVIDSFNSANNNTGNKCHHRARLFWLGFSPVINKSLCKQFLLLRFYVFNMSVKEKKKWKKSVEGKYFFTTPVLAQ